MEHLLSIRWNVDPTMFSIGSLDIRYYGLFWALAMMWGVWYFQKFIQREGLPEKVLDSIFWWGALSCIIGARLGHCLFYQPEIYLANPLRILNIREGGMASHGAAIGMLFGLWMFSRKNKLPYIWALDRVMIPVAIGGAGVRIGNLMNSEIYGVQTDLPWGFIFERAGETVPMHPTQIYEALCYLVTFAVMIWFYYRRDAGTKHPGLMFGVGMIGIFLSRFLIEFVKNPQVAFENDMTLVMGQWLSVPFIIVGIVFIVKGLHSKPLNIDEARGITTPKPKAAKVEAPRAKQK